MTKPSRTTETLQRRRDPQVLKGFRDYLPAQMLLRQDIIGRFRTVFERHGFDPLDTPAIEYLEVLTGKAGENEKLMYQFADQGGREVGLRYDLTVPLARVVAMHQSELVMPFKRYHIAPVWRAEKPQRGRFREFWQCDADIAGVASMAADAEVVAIIGEALDAVGLTEYVIHISHRELLRSVALACGVPSEHAGAVYRTIDKLAKIGPAKVVDLLSEQGISRAATERLIEIVVNEGPAASVLSWVGKELSLDDDGYQAVVELEELFDLLPAFGVGPERARFDLSLARGLDYYTGPVFEAIVKQPNVGSLAGGGRYSDLVGTFLGRSLPATGISLGLERIIEVVQEFGTLPQRQSTAMALVTVIAGELHESARLASELRRYGLNVELATQANRSIGDQLKYAGRKGIPYAIIAGPDERVSGEAAIKNLRTGEQTRAPLGELAHQLAELLSAESTASNGATVVARESVRSSG